MASIELKPVRGTRDVYPDDARIRRWLFGHWHAVAASFGFEPYDACVLESEDLYIRKAGDEITAQLYNFADKGDRRVALRPEMTPSLARMVMARQGTLRFPLRWYAIPQCFRYERMQRGRKREHYQWNMDIVGLDSVAAEVELMTAQVAFLERVGLGGAVSFRVSDRRLLEGHLAGLGITGEAFAAACVIVDKRDKIGRESTAEQLVAGGIPTNHAESILDLLEAPDLDAVTAIVGAENPGVVSLQSLLALAEASGIGGTITIDPSVVRGLSYYTGTVWELFDASGDLPRAIAGGGRYDRLLETLGGKPMPMVGFGFGDVVITEILADRGLLPAELKGVDDVVYPLAADQFTVATQIATHLRAQGRRVLVDYTERRFKHVIKAAEEDGAERLLVLGASEVDKGVCTVRTLGEQRDQTEVPLADLGVN